MESLKRFFQSTSIKGIPRACNTQSKPMRFVWVISVVSFLTVGCYQAYILTNEFLRYDVATSLKQYPVDVVGYTENTVVMPNMTFCNINPFGSNASMHSDIPSLEEYHRSVITATDCHGCPDNLERFFAGVRASLLKPSYYYGYIGVENVRRIGHSLESLLVSCQLILLEGRDTRLQPCFPDAEITLYNDVDYYNCYTLKFPPQSWPSFLYIGFNMVFHLDDFFTDHLKYLGSSYTHQRMSGIDFYMHHPDLHPTIGRDSTTLPPGVATNLKLRFRRYKRLSEPYGNCRENNAFDGRETYSQDLCYDICAQRVVFENCGCIDHKSFTHSYSEVSKNQSMCMELSGNTTELYNRGLCVFKQRNYAVAECGKKCRMPCEQLLYKSKVSIWLKSIASDFLHTWCTYLSEWICFFRKRNRYHKCVLPENLIEFRLCLTSRLWYDELLMICTE